ncbi:ArsR family transcriptional regulator [Halobium palmae]|uniref:ArsR family transcriptional regulator n=1 Tax=Halobium palmae TaxID=1776492 RepID=A0ABD5RZ54_9EURY
MSTKTNVERTLEEATIFHILGNDRRREVILQATRNGEVNVSELAQIIAEKEASGETTADELYKSVYVSLQQTHLPKLSDEAIVAYDAETKTIRPGPRLDDVEVYIDRGSIPRTTLSVPFAVSIVGLLVTVGAVLDLPILARIDVGLWGIVVLFLVVVSLAVGQGRIQRLL